MSELLLDIADWQERLRQRPLAIFLDYDGTLAPIAPTPAQAKLPVPTRKILGALLKAGDVRVAIISGRPLADLEQMVRIKGITYVGSHGIESGLPGAGMRRVPEKGLRDIEGLKRRLVWELREYRGVFFEEKPFSLAIHYRNVLPAQETKVRKIVLVACSEAVFQDRISVISGKKVIEIMPPRAMNKGKVVRRLLRAWGGKKVLPVFIGDDRTDETAFEALHGRGLTVRVGKPEDHSHAAYYVHDVEDVRAILAHVLLLKSGGK